MKPTVKPVDPRFSSGPCKKPPSWKIENLSAACLGRSHRAAVGKAKLAEVIDRSRAILGIPDDWRIGIVPASDTGAFEMAMWSVLGARGVDTFAWESFGSGWVTDIEKQLKITDLRKFTADYGEVPDFSAADPARDTVFTWNGTTSGARVPNGDWIDDDREGLTLCDATSAVFAMDIPWAKLDVVTWSWQKVMGGEGQHGMIVLSPRAVERLCTYTPPWPLPKIFRMTNGGKLIEGIFRGETINTPSMLCVEDALDGLRWAEDMGGLAGLMARCQGNFDAITDWVAGADWVDFLAADAAIRSPTSVCLKVVAPWFEALDSDAQAAAPKRMVKLLEEEGAGYDLDGYRDAPPGLRVWAASTVDQADHEALLPWLDWAADTVAAEAAA
ncbi:MAG: phosphoserine transaminase [Alphaproteobacteria bacterium]|nr:phosphoserine transaminase [Alphaproteobacteria bacterium]